MAATDQTYRKQKTLDIVFAVSCILMLLSTFWMFWQDYDREFKHVQREFRDVEEALNEHQMIAQLPSTKDVEKARKEADDAKKDYEVKHEEIRGKERELMAKHDLQDLAYRSIKADYDSKTSLLNIAVEHLGKAEVEDPSRKSVLQKEVDDLRKELYDSANGLQKQLADAQDALDKINRQIHEEVTLKLNGPLQAVNAAEDNLKRVTASFDRYAKVTAQKRWKFGDWFRALPIVDSFESPTKIKQLWLPDLTIDYGGFKDVPRYDRCISCHLAIERGSFDRAALTSLTRSSEVIQKDIDKTRKRRDAIEDKESDEFKRVDASLKNMEKEQERAKGMQARLDTARDILTKRKDAGENLGFNPSDLPDKVRWLNLTAGQIMQYAAHPRLDLFVDANSAHPMEKFGCTICHQGQGSATDFLLAAHTPADAVQEEEWHKEHGWAHSHFWDFPMLSSRFTESGCLKCHHEVTDLVRHGSKEEAPKLLRGYHLVQDNGCFGCHEISRIKAGREIGPDLRLEPQPALEYQTPAEQDKAKADPLNMPGQYRKVGPSLRRIAEKTNQEWVRKWIHAPRGFRPDTKMPHFYGLSNNSKEALPEDQQTFPDAEIAGIAHYLMAESKGNLERDEKKKDSTRQVLEKRIEELQKILAASLLQERDWKELTDASRHLGDIGLMSVPARANEINRLMGRQKQLQEDLQELRKKEANLKAKKDPESLSADETQKLDKDGKELDEVTTDLIDKCQIEPLAKKITDEEGKIVALPKKGDATKGRKLFTERGCLACHSHDSTEKAGDGVGAVHGEATFGPNLSRIAAKIAPEIASKGDLEEAKRRWIVQWVMNPTVYHPRTRMPITHLTPQDAADVAQWLLNQKVTDWDDKGPEEPKAMDLVALARLYLGKAPGFTRLDVENFLPANTGELPGIKGDRLDPLPPDADERKLSGPIKDDEEGRAKLKWYIGRKAINRLGCFGCHDVPGFETAKPIGTALNDWGKKDPERLAFEDADIFVRDSHNIVKVRNDPDDKNKPAPDWHAKDGKSPYEGVYFEALKHHRREGFLHQKLLEPRSYDFHRVRTWDDRLRMPQFRFARTKQKKDESDEAYQARRDFEEAEAREAVMTFILGLVAEPMPLKYQNRPKPDRLAEVKGHQVLEKFNCAGCHQVRPGLYEFKTSDEGLTILQDAVKQVDVKTDHVFPGHNAWVGAAQTSPDRLTIFGTEPKKDDTSYGDRTMLVVRLSDALRFAGMDGVVRNLPAGGPAAIVPENLTLRADPWGGTFTDLMVRYLPKARPDRFKSDNPDLSRAALPPPLIREGERVQPDWVYGFLLNPPPIRPPDYMMLRMPKFNMSSEDARALANYFSGVSRLTNPGAGVTAEYVDVHQRDEQYWRARTADYIKRLKAVKKKNAQDKTKTFDEAVKEMEPLWHDALKRRIAEAEAGMDAAEQAVKDAKEAEAKDPKKAEERKQKESDVANRKAALKKWKEELAEKKYGSLRRQWEESGAYATDAYRLMIHRTPCLQCHSVGDVESSAPQGPNLALSARRLRPQWVREWIGNPNRLFGYKTIMPQNFPNDSLDYQEVFVGKTIDQVTAVRDVLMDLQRVADMPGNRSRAPVTAGGGK